MPRYAGNKTIENYNCFEAGTVVKRCTDSELIECLHSVVQLLQLHFYKFSATQGVLATSGACIREIYN